MKNDDHAQFLLILSRNTIKIEKKGGGAKWFRDKKAIL